MAPRVRTVTVVVATLIVASALVWSIWPTSVNSGQTLAYARWIQAYNDAVDRFRLEVRDWTLLSMEDLVRDNGLANAARPTSPWSTDVNLIIHEILTNYHTVGDVLPVFLLSPDGRTLLVALKRFESGVVCLVTARFVGDNWEVISVIEK